MDDFEEKQRKNTRKNFQVLTDTLAKTNMFHYSFISEHFNMCLVCVINSKQYVK